ncbi:MAG: YlxR family protein [Clostridiales bacterium]|jgi:predicted RNA-binding protein YlxR (DUF448 family)|nr:YlxR family protein [Clostridiales bacterium]
MKEKKRRPERMCIACRAMKDKAQLIRIVRSPEDVFSLDQTGKARGRGAYVCNDIACIQKCAKARLLNKSFKTKVDEGVYQALLEEFTRL